MSPIIIKPRVKNEGLGFNDIKEKAMITKITLVKEKDVADLVFSS
jgi:hypothetical protein